MPEIKTRKPVVYEGQALTGWANTLVGTQIRGRFLLGISMNLLAFYD